MSNDVELQELVEKGAKIVDVIEREVGMGGKDEILIVEADGERYELIGRGTRTGESLFELRKTEGDSNE